VPFVTQPICISKHFPKERKTEKRNALATNATDDLERICALKNERENSHLDTTNTIPIQIGQARR
jgi:hypothetical protein